MLAPFPSIIEKMTLEKLEKVETLETLETLETQLWSWPTEEYDWTTNNKSFGCEHELHLSETLWIVMPTWDNPERLNAALESVMGQEKSGFTTVHVVVFGKSKSIRSFQKQASNRMNMTVTFIQAPLISSTYKMKLGPSYEKWILLEWIRKHALPHEYIFVPNGDDTLNSNGALRYFYHTLINEKPWFALGQINGEHSDRCGPPSKLSLKRTQQLNWSFCHLQIFQSHLLHHLEKEDFHTERGLWLQNNTDLPFINKFMGLAGPKRITSLNKRAVYNYTKTSNNSVFITPKQSISERIKNLFMPTLEIPEPITIIACVYDRNNTKIFLQRLKASILDPQMVLRIHICNNNYKRQRELVDVAVSLNQAQESHYVTIHNMGANLGGRARFVLAQKIMKKEFLSYIMMIDDDQYVVPSTIALVYRQREPRTYKAWYGKNWDYSCEGEDLKYFKPFSAGHSNPTFMYEYSKHIKSWAYGGTGMSIVDAAIFKTEELFQLDPKFYFVEDMWLSYLVTLLGWPIKRLFLQFDNAAEESRTGQWRSLVPIKEEFFRKVENFSCGSPGEDVPAVLL